MAGEGFSRRHFFFGTLLAGAIPSGGFASTPSLKAAGYKSPNEKLNIAAIGAGGRAEIDIAGCATENIVAFADPDDVRAAPSYKKYEKAARYRDFRKMLHKEAKNIDAVIIGIPDHTHTVAAMACMQLGKHVYVEKPLTRTLWEARLLADAAAKYKVATQMGNQGYSLEGERIAAEIIWSGEIGNVTEIHAWTDRPVWPQGIATLPPGEKVPETLDWDVWLGPAAMRPYSPAYVPFNWRGWFDFGCGSLGDMACHILGAANMALKLGAPTSVEVLKRVGKNSYTFPKQSTTRFEFPARGAMPGFKLYWYDGAKEPAYRPEGLGADEPYIGGVGSFGANGVIYTGAGPMRTPPPSSLPQAQGSVAQLSASRPDRNGCLFVGERGMITTDTYGANVRLLPESRHKEYKLPPQLLTRSPGHYRDWIRAAKGGDPACSNFAVSGPFTEWVLLGALATRFDGKLEWDAAKVKVTNLPEAKPVYRKGWQVSL